MLQHRHREIVGNDESGVLGRQLQDRDGWRDRYVSVSLFKEVTR
jgi:hypothetical protein